MMYKNWATITIVAILSMFHSSVSLGDSVLKVLHESSQKPPKFHVEGFSTSRAPLPIMIFSARGSELPIYYLEPLEKSIKYNGLYYEWQITSNAHFKPGSYEAKFCVVKNRYRSVPCWWNYNCNKYGYIPTCYTTKFEYVHKQLPKPKLGGVHKRPPKLKLNANNRLRPIWSWKMDSVEKCQCQL